MIIGLFRILLIIVLVYYTAKFFVWLFQGSKTKINDRKRYTQQGERPSKKEGEVTIDYIPKNKKKNSDDSGEYIDFEEVGK